MEGGEERRRGGEELYLRRRFLEEDQESLQDQVGEPGADGDVVWRDEEPHMDQSPDVCAEQ